MAWLALQCHHTGCGWVWTGYSAAAKSAWAAHATVKHAHPVKVSCTECDAEQFELCAQCNGAATAPTVAVEAFSVTTYEASLLAALLEKAVAANLGRRVNIERAPGRRGGYDGAFLSQSIITHACIPKLTCLLRIVAPAPRWVLRTVLTAAPLGTAISPLLGWHQATAIALRTGRFSPGGGRCVLSLRAACEVESVDPAAVIAAVAAWPSQYVPCAIAACSRRRHGLAAALSTQQPRANASVVTTLLADAAPQYAIDTAINSGFVVSAAALTAALRQRPIHHSTLDILLAAAPPAAITPCVVAAATQAAAYDRCGVKALTAVIKRHSGAPATLEQAMRCALMTGNAAAWTILRNAGGELPNVGRHPGRLAATAEVLVYATCRMRGVARRDALCMLVGRPTRRTEIKLRQIKSPELPIAEWACAMLSEADAVGVREFVRWAGPLLDAQPDWKEAIHAAAAAFANMVRPDEYLAIATAYGSRITPSPLAAMIGLCDADAEAAIQWLVDCRPHVLTVGELVQLAEWSSVAAMACDVRGPECPRRPAWWRTMAATVLLCCGRTERAPPELARHICSFVVSSTATGSRPERDNALL